MIRLLKDIPCLSASFCNELNTCSSILILEWTNFLFLGEKDDEDEEDDDDEEEYKNFIFLIILPRPEYNNKRYYYNIIITVFLYRFKKKNKTIAYR